MDHLRGNVFADCREIVEGFKQLVSASKFTLANSRLFRGGIYEYIYRDNI